MDAGWSQPFSAGISIAGDREIADIVDHRITVRDAEAGGVIETGRYV
ncbi:hypothetical protein OG892_04220 [Streptomyces sp. NBC_00341]|nr:hypothetical protein OG892_04220 [Streptomyces sp. NBC_00341]